MEGEQRGLREDWVLERHVEGDVADPRSQLRVQIHESKLLITINGETETVDVPDDVFTTHTAACYQRHTLTITTPRRDPNGPAMMEKRMIDPDKRPRDVDVTLPPGSAAFKKLADKQDPRRGPTPAEVELEERNPDMYGEPSARYEMPQANMGSSVATANPVMFQKGGAVDTVSQGETVVALSGSTEVQHVNADAMEGSGLTPEDVARRLSDTVLRDHAPPGGQVLFGQREKEVEREYAADAPGGAEGDQGGPGHAEGATVPVDWAQEKVGMERRARRAADAYPVTDSRRNEPISSVKQPGEACDVCACNPCQCDKLRSTYRVPTEFSAPETKRVGKPHMAKTAKPTTGVNAHDARDFRMHAKPRDEHHAGIGARTADWEGNVPRATGDFHDYDDQLAKAKHVYTGGAEIPLNPDTGKGVARGALGGHTVG